MPAPGTVGTRTVAPLSVVVPTIGRPALLRRCLASIASGDVLPAEVLVVDQSGGAMADVVAQHGTLGFRVVPCDGTGIALGTNLGLREAAHDHVAVTHDDCTVAADWVAEAARHTIATPDAIVTGRVLPGGDPDAVPSTKTDPTPHDFTGQRRCGVLYPANMVLPRRAVLDLGGFDERPSLRLAAEDNDLCYRWLCASRPLRYEPSLVVTHERWRTEAELAALYVTYGRGQGAFVAKHLVAGDRHMLRVLASDLRRGARGLAAGVRHRRPAWSDERRGLLRGLPAGLLAGVRDEVAIRARRRRGAARAR